MAPSTCCVGRDDYSRSSNAFLLTVHTAGTHNVPADQLATDGLRKAPMPNNDFNTRIVLFGLDFAQARALADAVGKTPFQNVSYFPGTFDALAAAVKT